MIFPMNRPLKRRSAIIAYIRNSIDYEVTDDFWGALSTLTKKSGDCDNYSTLFAALARVNNIPSMSVYGIYASKRTFGGYLHAWNEVFLPKTGWTIVDITADKPITNNVDKNYIGFSNLLFDSSLNNGSLYKCEYTSNTPPTVTVKFRPTIEVQSL